MLEVRLDAGRSILFLHPTSALQKADFEHLSKTVDPHVEKTGGLAGLILGPHTSNSCAGIIRR